jgi:hypothetical protein
MRALSKHFAELWLSYVDVHICPCRRYQRMPQPFRQVAANVELYIRVCLRVFLKAPNDLPHPQECGSVRLAGRAERTFNCLLSTSPVDPVRAYRQVLMNGCK